jgi:hypothetical protein
MLRTYGAGRSYPSEMVFEFHGAGRIDWILLFSQFPDETEKDNQPEAGKFGVWFIFRMRFKALSYWGRFDGFGPGAEDGEEVHGI